MATEDVLHLVFQLELPLLEGDFFELFGFGEVMLGGQFMQAIFKFVMLHSELLEFRVRLQQLCFQILRLCIHAPPPWTSIKRGVRERWRGPCGCIKSEVTSVQKVPHRSGCFNPDCRAPFVSFSSDLRATG